MKRWKTHWLSQLAVKESGVDEPELGNPKLDKLVLDKLKELPPWQAPTTYTFWVWPRMAGQSFKEWEPLQVSQLGVAALTSFSVAISGLEEEVIELDDSLRWDKVS
nr:hypothetical protein [Tanacetum cinerariifolium]